MTALKALPLLCIFAAIYFLLAMAETRLRVQTPGRFATAPAEWWVRIWLTPEEEDRVLRVIADGPTYRSSDIALAGLRSAKVHQVWLRDLQGGCYEFIAEVLQRDGDGPIVARAVAPWPLTVLGPGVDGTACD